jgi:hypothetical protein
MLSGKTALVREASLGPRASLFVSAGVVAHTLWTAPHQRWLIGSMPMNGT